jgi:hypothetical protein
MTKINRKLLATLGFSWMGFAIAGILINLLFPIPTVAILIDRSYCPPDAWKQVVQQYDALYSQHQQKHLKIQQVIVFSDLGEDFLPSIPSQDEIQSLSTYGRQNLDHRSKLATQYPNAQLLSCPV